MRETVYKTPYSQTDIVRDDSDESGKYYFHQRVFDDPILERNRRVRLEGLMAKGQRLPGVAKDGGDAQAAYAFSIPADQFARFQRDHVEIMLMLRDKDPQINMRGAQLLLEKHPEWSVMEANR